MIKIERDNIESIASDYFDKIKIIKRRKMSSMHKVFIDNLEEIVLCKSFEFENIISKYNSDFSENNYEFETFKKYMKNQYKIFIDENGLWLAEQLKVNVCPYCNRQYTFTINSKKKTRPQFDHFYPKSKYPYLALSFYNLIPCCPVCNSMKNEDMIDCHPYVKGFDNEFLFSFNHLDYILTQKEIEIILKSTNNRMNRNIETFALNELYAKHKDYVQEIIDKAYAYNDDYYNGIIETFSAIGKSSSEINRLIFGNYIEIAEHEKRPLSKLTKDILEQIRLK
ncbi:MAG: HNH endonuclease [Bacteroidales bacterium]|jgi:hypothetical protein|nr:HNH endonuclease [Bacteroidales bacterium]